MELRHLRYFVTVVEAGSFTAAAAALHLSQPPLSVAIAKLEADVGVNLLVRTPRGVEPTSAGRYLHDAAARVLGDIDDIAAALRRFDSGTAGSLTLAAVPVLMWHRVPELLRAHAVDAPDLEIRLVDPPPWAAMEMLPRRKADLAAIVVAQPRRFVARHRGELDIYDWGPIPLVAALPPDSGHLPNPLPLNAFDRRVVLVPRRAAAVPSLPEAVEAAFHRHGIVPASIRTVDTIQAGLPLIEAGLGWAVLPDPDGRSLRRFAVRIRKLNPAPTPLRAVVLTRPGAAADAMIGRLVDRIAASDENSSDHV